MIPWLRVRIQKYESFILRIYMYCFIGEKIGTRDEIVATYWISRLKFSGT